MAKRMIERMTEEEELQAAMAQVSSTILGREYGYGGFKVVYRERDQSRLYEVTTPDGRSSLVDTWDEVIGVMNAYVEAFAGAGRSNPCLEIQARP